MKTKKIISRKELSGIVEEAIESALTPYGKEALKSTKKSIKSAGKQIAKKFIKSGKFEIVPSGNQRTVKKKSGRAAASAKTGRTKPATAKQSGK